MAPEMVAGGPIDVRTDVYLIGATLHEILVGAPRHDAPTIRATLLAALASEPVDYPPSVPAPLARLANAATSAEPSARPATAAEVRDALAAYKRHASSIALAASAAARIAKLRDLVEDAAALGDEGRLREIDVVAAEARFAIGEALRAWGDNAEALEAKRALDALLESRRARSAELERLARELDPGVSSGSRMVTFAVLAVSGLALSGFGLVVDRRDVSTTELLCESLAPLALVVLSAAILRRRLSKNAINRRAIAALVVVLATISADRAVALVLAVPAAHVVVFDLLAMAMASAVGAAFAFRWLTLTAAGLFATAFVAAALPESTIRVFSAGTGLMLLSTLFLAWRS